MESRRQEKKQTTDRRPLTAVCGLRSAVCGNSKSKTPNSKQIQNHKFKTNPSFPFLVRGARYASSANRFSNSGFNLSCSLVSFSSSSKRS